MFGRSFSGYVANTFGVAGASALIATSAAVWLVYAERLHPARWLRACVRAATLGYALPGAIVAVGVLVPLTRVDRWFALTVETEFGVRASLWLTGTVVALVFAYVVRFLTVAYNACHGGIEKIHTRLDDVSRTLGAGPVRVLREVHVPLMLPAVASSLLLVFIDVVKEFARDADPAAVQL